MAATHADAGCNGNDTFATEVIPIPRALKSPIPIALIMGITSHDGSYLMEFLLSKGYEVHSLIRRSSNFNTQRINHIYIDPHKLKGSSSPGFRNRMFLHYVDLTDASSLRSWLDTILPNEVYNLAAQSHVSVSFEIPYYTFDVVATDAHSLLESIRSHLLTREYLVELTSLE